MAQMPNTARRLTFATLCLLALGAAVRPALASSHGHPRCERIEARVTLAASTDPGCTSPIALCATGELRGDLRGNSSFIGSSAVPSVDTAATAVILLTGDNVIHTREGDLYTKDAIVLSTVGAGEFAEVDTVVGGTGDYAGATGTLTATGTFANGAGQGRLQGQICTP